MRSLFLLGLIGLVGCQSVVTPFDARRPERPDDPLLSSAEQQRKGRYLLPYADPELSPTSTQEPPVPSPHNR